MNSASSRAGTMVTTRGHRSRDSCLGVSSSNARSCQNAPRKKVSTTQISSDTTASMRASKLTPHSVPIPNLPPPSGVRKLLRIQPHHPSSSSTPQTYATSSARIRRRAPRGPRLSNPARPVVARLYVHFHLRRLVHPHHVVIIEVRLLHAPIGNGNLALQRCRQTINNSTLNLRANCLRIYVTPAIPRRHRASDLDRMRLAVNADLRHFRHVASKRFHYRNSPVTPSGQRLRPSRLFRRQFEHPALPRILAQQPAPEFKRILPRCLRQFVHKTFRNISVVRISHRPPESHRHAGLRQQVLHQKIRHVVFQRRNPFRRRIIQTVFHRSGEKSRHDRRPHNP